MCDPISLIGGALSIGASVVQAQQQAAYQAAVNQANKDAYEISKRAREQEQARQAAFEKEAAGHWENTTNALARENMDSGKAEAEEQFIQNYDAMTSAIPEGHLLSGQEYASEEVKDYIAQSANKAAAEARKRVQALAALSSSGTMDVNRNLALGNNANTLTTLNGIRRGSLGVSAQEQNISPAQVTQRSSILGDVLSGAGGLVSGMAGKGTAVNPYKISPAATAAINRGAVGLY